MIIAGEREFIRASGFMVMGDTPPTVPLPEE